MKVKERFIECDVGDTVWIAIGAENLVEGKVVHKFKLCDYPNCNCGGQAGADGTVRSKCFRFEHYVVQIETSVDPVLHVRDGFTISDAPDKALAFWRNRD